jgi:hypothetical protein
MTEENKDFQPGPWWATVSGAGTPNASVPSWADDYTRHRIGRETTFADMDSVIGRKESIQDVNP